MSILANYLRIRQEVTDYVTIDMKYLSMGMTNSYKVAIEEGSNMVRIGIAIFGRRSYSSD
jgi:uncharacterized pyridoxal phosphate-containing UPF0001 family protein